MKNKKLVYLLIALTVVVWGLVFYRIFHYVNENETPAVALKDKHAAGDKQGAYADTFKLMLDYRDPFLGNGSANDEDAEPKKNNDGHQKEKVIAEQKNTNINWPVLYYGGIVKNEGTKNMVIILNINGKSHLMKPGETVKDCKLLNVYHDSASVSFNNEVKTVKYKSNK